MLSNNTLLNELDGLNKFALKLCKNRSDAEDLVQTTVEKAIANNEKFEEGTKPFSWLSRIMYNSFVTSYNRKTRYESQYDPEPLILAATCESNQETNVMFNEVTTAMQYLNPQHKEILILVCAQEMSYEEVSQQLQIPLGTVRSRLSRARQQLMEIMSGNDNILNTHRKNISERIIRSNSSNSIH